MLKQYKAFKNNWISFTEEYNSEGNRVAKVNLTPAFFNKLSLDQDSLKSYRIKAAQASKKQLGARPVLCLSGGIDSQAMIQCWQEADLEFDIAIMVFNNDLNKHDVEHARLYCDTYVKNHTVVEVPINVISFLNRESYDMGIKYQCTSPQFATHFQFFDALRNLGYTGICAGGDAPFRSDQREWYYRIHLDTNGAFINYTMQNNFPVIGNFLGYDPALAWSLAFLTIEFAEADGPTAISQIFDLQQRRYIQKVRSYQAHGLNIIPQAQKYTGFERVKDYYGEKHKDGWTFEKKFRMPLQSVLGTQIFHTTFTDKQLESMERNYISKTLDRATEPLPGLANNFAPK